MPSMMPGEGGASSASRGTAEALRYLNRELIPDLILLTLDSDMAGLEFVPHAEG